MDLGIIASATEENFRLAQLRGLDFVELLVNEGDDPGNFCSRIGQLQQWKEQYGIKFGSIGRWKSLRIDREGQLIEKELQICYQLIDAASNLGCPNFVSGCNYVEELSYFDNCSAAIRFFSKLIEYAVPKGVKVLTYNCRKVNFVNNPEVWKIVHGHLPELGIKFDPSHSRYFGGDYLKETLEWGHRFHHVHLKGSLLVDGCPVDDPPAGLDQTDWKSFLALLRAKGYTGGLSIEPHSKVWTGELEGKGIEFTIDYIKSLLLKE
ncbi:sugar phosphate isomerase/epimerase family protein [Paenibacillus oleatilyticus]|uniref:Sugar phosphate isomerase/epimerase family protein n=1 Tax=Paenibacillus oleatilyticus TaxID=2594886 RepID=A0ABV4V3M9_9BACL